MKLRQQLSFLHRSKAASSSAVASVQLEPLPFSTVSVTCPFLSIRYSILTYSGICLLNNPFPPPHCIGSMASVRPSPCKQWQWVGAHHPKPCELFMEQTASFLANPAAAPFCNQGISVWARPSSCAAWVSCSIPAPRWSRLNTPEDAGTVGIGATGFQESVGLGQLLPDRRLFWAGRPRFRILVGVVDFEAVDS
jgi:hypothetical protein